MLLVFGCPRDFRFFKRLRGRIGISIVIVQVCDALSSVEVITENCRCSTSTKDVKHGPLQLVTMVCGTTARHRCQDESNEE